MILAKDPKKKAEPEDEFEVAIRTLNKLNKTGSAGAIGVASLGDDSDNKSDSGHSGEGSAFGNFESSSSSDDGEADAYDGPPQPDFFSVDYKSAPIKNGYKVTFKGHEIGKITAWGIANENISCVCSKHSACRMPAMVAKKIGEDRILVDWLLLAIDHEANTRLTRAEHLDLQPS